MIRSRVVLQRTARMLLLRLRKGERATLRAWV